MNKKQQISDANYSAWIEELKHRYLHGRLQAAMAVNSSMLAFYWSIGRDIAARQYQNSYGSAFYKQLSKDMRRVLPDVRGLSETNLKYMYYFYSLYAQRIENRPQGVDDFGMPILLQGVDDSNPGNLPQPTEEFTLAELCSISWFHRQRIIDKCKDNVDKAIFFVRKSRENAWGRAMLLNFLCTDLYEREGKAVTNFVGIILFSCNILKHNKVKI